MFSDCKTLAQLNAARIHAASTHDIVEVNNSYNKRRMELLRASSGFKRVLTTQLTPKQSELISYAPYIGAPVQTGHIEWTPNGFRA